MDKYEQAISNCEWEILCAKRMIQDYKNLIEVELGNLSRGSGETLVTYSTKINDYLKQIKSAEQKIQLIKLLRDSE